MSLKNEKYKNKLENGRKKKFGKEFAEIPKGKHYVEDIPSHPRDFSHELDGFAF